MTEEQLLKKIFDDAYKKALDVLANKNVRSITGYSDHLNCFVDDCIKQVPSGLFTYAEILYQVYIAYCRKHHLPSDEIKTKSSFYKSIYKVMKDRKLQFKKNKELTDSSNQYFICGISCSLK